MVTEMDPVDELQDAIEFRERCEEDSTEVDVDWSWRRWRSRKYRWRWCCECSSEQIAIVGGEVLQEDVCDTNDQKTS